MTCLVSSPANGYTIIAASTTWSGGSDVQSYMTDDPSAAAPTSKKPVLMPANPSGTSYSFVVDATPRTYDIDVKVVYTNGAKGESNITFTSGLPNFTFTNVKNGEVGGGVVYKGPSNNPNNMTGVYVGMMYAADPQTDGRIEFTGDTSYETDPNMIGDFMIMQLIQVSANMVVADGTQQGASHDLSSGGQLVLDGGPSGQPLLSSTENSISRSWTSIQYGSSFGTSFDFPYFTTALSSKSLRIADSFQTYLMYRPQNGSWVALSEYDWDFTGSGNNSKFMSPDGQFQWNPYIFTQPSPTQSTPSGLNAFPSWNSKYDTITLT